jgi:hypothetical protein
LSAEVGTADGDLHKVDAGREPDLFWALRGGGCNVGAVLWQRYRLHPGDGGIAPAWRRGRVRKLRVAVVSGVLVIVSGREIQFTPLRVVAVAR